MGEYLRETFASLDSYNFRLFFGATVLRSIAAWMSVMGMSWLILNMTHSGAALGATWGLYSLPVLLFGVWGGPLVDRFDRRKVLLVTQPISASLMFGLWLCVLLGYAHLWVVVVAILALGTVMIFDGPAINALNVEMVGADRVTNAISLSNAAGNASRMIGPTMAGVLIAWGATAWVFFIDGVSFLQVAVALLLMRRLELRPVEKVTGRGALKAGIRYTWRIRELRGTALLFAVTGLLVFNTPNYLTLLARHFHGSAGLAGVMMAMFGAGSLIGGLVAARHATPTAATVARAACVLGLSLLAVALIPSEKLVLVALVPFGAVAIYFIAVASGHVLVASEPNFHGRVTALCNVLLLGLPVFGAPLIGWLCQQWGKSVGIAFIGTVTVLAALYVASFVRAGRQRTVLEAAPAALPGTDTV
jgi:MFS family permease